MQVDPVDSKNSFRITLAFQTKKFILWRLKKKILIRINWKKSVTKLFSLKTYNGFEAIFGIYRVDLHNRILISTWLDDLHFSASNTVEAVAKMAWRLAPFGPRGLKFWVWPQIMTPQLGFSLQLDISKLTSGWATLLSRSVFWDMQY